MQKRNSVQTISDIKWSVSTQRVNIHRGMFAVNTGRGGEFRTPVIGMVVSTVSATVATEPGQRDTVRAYGALVYKTKGTTKRTTQPAFLTLTGVAGWRFIAEIRDAVSLSGPDSWGPDAALYIRAGIRNGTVDNAKHGSQSVAEVSILECEWLRSASELPGTEGSVMLATIEQSNNGGEA